MTPTQPPAEPIAWKAVRVLVFVGVVVVLCRAIATAPPSSAGVPDADVRVGPTR